MVEGLYDVVMRTPLGAKKAKVELSLDGATLKAHVMLKGKEETSIGSCEGNTFFFDGSAKTPVGLMPYEVQGSVDGEAITATCKTKKGSFEITGKRA